MLIFLVKALTAFLILVDIPNCSACLSSATDFGVDENML